MWFKRKYDFRPILDRHIDQELELFACDKNPPADRVIRMFEKSIGFKLPDDFCAFSTSQFGGLYIAVREEFWPRAKEYEVGPFWSFLYGFAVYGFGTDIPEWMDIRKQKEAFGTLTGSKFVPFLKIMGQLDIYCFSETGDIFLWHHETGEFDPVEKSFPELLDSELLSLVERKEKKKALLKSESSR